MPLIIVSPFAKAHYVSHTPMDYTAVLKFVEKRFNLPNLTARDAAQPDMDEFFDFANSPNLNPGTPASQPIGLAMRCYVGVRDQRCAVSVVEQLSNQQSAKQRNSRRSPRMKSETEQGQPQIRREMTRIIFSAFIGMEIAAMCFG